jgi:hypothetical protein
LAGESKVDSQIPPNAPDGKLRRKKKAKRQNAIKLPSSLKEFRNWARARSKHGDLPHALRTAFESRVPKILERLESEKQEYQRNSHYLRRNFFRFAEAHRLLNGECSVRNSPDGMRAFAHFLRFIDRVLDGGHQFVKDWALSLRIVYCEGSLKTFMRRFVRRLPTVQRSHIASTLVRATIRTISDEEKEASCHQAMQTWLSAPELSGSVTETKRSLTYFITQVISTPIRKTNDVANYPIPSNKSCLTHNRKEGGVAAALRSWDQPASYFEEVEKVEPKPMSRRRRVATMTRLGLGKFPEEIRRRLYRVRVANKRVYVAMSAKENKTTVSMVDCYGTGKIPPPKSFKGPREYTNDYLPRTWHNACFTVLTRSEFRVAARAISNHNKVRAISLHDADEVHVARGITSRYIPVLKNLRCHRRILRNEKVKLSTTCLNAKLFSADLQKGTDPVPHEIAQHTFGHIATCFGENPELIAMGRKILGPKYLEEVKQFTKRGIHMGLGLSWVVLSILNAWAAWEAGLESRSYQICGDDLIALATPHQRTLYLRNLRRVGLVPNVRKSFYGKVGVFCEQLVEMTSELTAESKPYPQMSEITATTTFFQGKKGRRYQARKDLGELLKEKQPKIVKQIARRTIARLTNKIIRRVGGPVELGGNGQNLLLNDFLLARALKHGAPGLTRSDVELGLKGISTAREPYKGMVPLEKLAMIKIREKTIINRIAKVTKPLTRSISDKEFQRISKGHARFSRGEMIKLCKNSKHILSRSRRLFIRTILRRGNSTKTLDLPLSPMLRRRLTEITLSAFPRIHVDLKFASRVALGERYPAAHITTGCVRGHSWVRDEDTTF